MQLYSTKNKASRVSLEEAVFKGLPPDNGLYMPEAIPALPASFFEQIEHLSFQEIAFRVCQALIGSEIPDEELKSIVSDVLTFDAPVIKVEEGMHVLELFHGPSFAFKDFGARFMARLMSYFLQKEKKEITILVATSGDTGSAVAQGFYNMPGIRVVILYPSGKVSEIQEKQLTTLGGNVTALEVAGTFDDCQRMVKEAFLDASLTSQMMLSSANSINISRLIPQSFYYFYAYAQLKPLGKPVVFCTPSGNFGNLCGGLFAQRMGLPVHAFIASTNANDIVPAYLKSGVFHPKPSVATISNAMDVGNPSNFARIQDLYDGDLEKTKAHISGYSFNDAQTREAMRSVYRQSGYIMCPHTAVAYLGLKQYQSENPTAVNGVFLATAHPAKFVDIVEETIESRIQIPVKLQEAMNKPKQSIPLANKFEDLKNYLLQRK
ncbi:MAG: threonine synthase [Cytophagaceae bacterium]|jgi:threonine synthase|nr:threonine synthase [Cytophagaceae bacterium]